MLPTAVTALILLAWTHAAAAQLAERPPTEVSRLDAYLERLGLAGLQIRHLERELERPRSTEAKAGIAVRLAEVYADRLLSATEAKEVTTLTESLTRLVRAHPAAETPRVRLTLLEGDYNRAEAQALKWVGDPFDLAARTDALARLGRCRPTLDGVRDDLLKRIERGNEALDRADEGPRRDALERELQAIGQVAGRATYFASWAMFYETLLSPAGSEGVGFRAAAKGFRRLLGAGDEPIQAADLDGLDAEIPARVALGLALAELSGGDRDTGRQVFQALRGPNIHPSVRDWVDRWQVWALLRAGLGAEAEAVARTAVEGLSAPFSPAKGALCAVLIRGVPLAPGDVPGPAAAGQADRIALLGVRGLIRLGRPDLARQLLGGRDLSAAAPPGALTHWLRAQGALHSAEADGGADDYTRAHSAFAAALAAPDAGREPVLAADCRFGLAWCLFRLGDLASAREAFLQAAAALKAQNLAATDAEWMALMTGWNLSDDLPARRLGRIATEARAFRANHPGDPRAGRVDELVAQLRNELAPPEDLMRDASSDAATRLALCRKLHRRWGELPAAERLGSPQTATLADEVRAGLAQVTAADVAGRLDLLLMAVDLALVANPPDRDRARAALAEAAGLVSKLPLDDTRVVEERFRRFQFARADGDAAAVREHALWLADHPCSHGQERAALTALAEQADEAVRAATAPQRPARAAEALEIHRRLAGALGDFPDRVRTNPTLRLVYFRIARYALDADQPQIALRYLQLLRLARPADAEVLRLAGLAHARVDQPDRALACWRTLLDGLPRDSEAWFEAKFHQMECLARNEPARARRLWDQFRVLHPELGPGPWPARFRDLAARLP